MARPMNLLQLFVSVSACLLSTSRAAGKDDDCPSTDKSPIEETVFLQQKEARSMHSRLEGTDARLEGRGDPCQAGINRTHSWTKCTFITGITNLQELPFELQGRDGRAKIPSSKRSCAQEVPKTIHFIWLGSELTWQRAENILGAASKNPSWKVMLWLDFMPGQNVSAILDSASIRTAGPIMLLNVSDHEHRFQTWESIRNSTHPERRAAHLRLEVVYLHGGLYLDTDVHAKQSFDDYANEHGSLFQWPFVVYDGTAYRNLCNCAFGDSPHSSFLGNVLRIMSEIEQKGEKAGGEYGCGILTGAFHLYNQSDIQMIPDDVMLHEGDNHNIMYQTFEASWTKDDYGL